MRMYISKTDALSLRVKSISVFIINSLLSFIVLHRSMYNTSVVQYLDKRLTNLREEIDRDVETMFGRIREQYYED